MNAVRRRTLLAAACTADFAAPALAQNTIKIAGLCELSGAGASAGTFKNGVEVKDDRQVVKEVVPPLSTKTS